jgi:hypothetical protein
LFFAEVQEGGLPLGAGLSIGDFFFSKISSVTVTLVDLIAQLAYEVLKSTYHDIFHYNRT